MATTKDIKLYGTLGSAVGKPITTTSEIYDDTQLKNQQEINAELYKKIDATNYIKTDNYIQVGSKMPSDEIYLSGGTQTEVFSYTIGPEDTDNLLWVLQNNVEPLGKNNRDARLVHVFARSNGYWTYVGDANLDSYEETNKNIGSSELIYFDEGVFDKMKCVFGRKNEFADLFNTLKASALDSAHSGNTIEFLVNIDNYLVNPYEDDKSSEYMTGSISYLSTLEYDCDKSEFTEYSVPGLTLTLPQIPYATSTSAGVMSAADKQKLDGISSTGETACVSSVTYTADTTKGTINVVNANNTTLTTEVSGATTEKAGLISAADKKSLDAVSALKFEIKNGVLTLVDGDTTYCVSLQPYTTPTAPTITSSTDTYELCVGEKATVTITNKDSRTCIINYNDGSAKTATVEAGKTITITFTSTGANESMRYPIIATATCNGLASTQASKEIVIKRKVAKPVITISGDKYDKTRTITAACATSGASIKYSDNYASSWTDITSSGVSVTTTAAARKYSFTATASTWVNSDYTFNESQIVVGAKPVYIGFGAETLADETAITSMEGVQKIKKDAPAGTYTVSNTNKGVYLWICSAGTVSGVTSSGFAVPMNAATTIDGYTCYRSTSAVQITGAQTFVVA